MPAFSKLSRDRLATCDPALQGLFNKVIETRDCAILEGFRDREGQDLAFRSGRSQKRWPDSKHNSTPARAVHAAPFPVQWQKIDRFIYFGGYVMGVASQMGIPLRWGGDFNQNNDPDDDNLHDFVHFELL